MKNTLILLLILFLCISFIFQKNKIKKSNNYYKVASEDIAIIKDCDTKYNNHNFEKAANCYSDLVQKYNNIAEIKFYYGISLINSGDYIKASNILQEIVQNKKTNKKIISEAQKILDEIEPTILRIKQRERSDMGNYYMELKKKCAWKHPQSIKVYIYEDYNKKHLLKQAFDLWDEKLLSTINFVYTNNEKDADITAKAVDKSELDTNQAGVTYNTFNYYTNSKKLYCSRSEIKIAYNKNETEIDDNFFKTAALHEIGHAIGIISHSPNQYDIMYYSTESYQRNSISNRDINTIKKLYGNI